MFKCVWFCLEVLGDAFFFLTLDNYVNTTMRNITDDSTVDNSILDGTPYIIFCKLFFLLIHKNAFLNHFFFFCRFCWI